MLVYLFYKTHYAIIFTRTNKIDSFHTLYFLLLYPFLYSKFVLEWNHFTKCTYISWFYNQHTQLIARHTAANLWKPSVVQGLIVANHRSYFDPIIMLNHRQTFRRKKEVESWPLIGYICKISEFFVDRKDPENRQNTCESIKTLNKTFSY
jgi:1-acyl-sn-glycerol-3-phosphate acyltransferase